MGADPGQSEHLDCELRVCDNLNPEMQVLQIRVQQPSITFELALQQAPVSQQLHGLQQTNNLSGIPQTLLDPN